MKGPKQKREEIIKQIRSKQRYEKFSQNRQKLFASYEDESLISLIFLMIDKDQQEISAESFEDFLEIISNEVLGASQEEEKINQGIINAILQRYRSLLRQFQEKVKNCDPIGRISLVYQGSKEFDLIRFLFRLQFVEKTHLNVLDLLLESAGMKFKQLIDGSIQIQCNKFQENYRLTLDEFIMVFQLRFKLNKQVSYLYFLSTQRNNQGTENPRLQERQRQMIVSLTEKQIEKEIFLDFLFFSQFVHLIRRSHQHWQKLQQLIQKYGQFYLEFLVQNNQIFMKIINSKDLIQNPKKVIELLFMLFSLGKKKQNVEIEITQNHHNSLDESLILFMDLGIRVIKAVQVKIADCGETNPQSQKFNSQLLKCLIDSFVEEPFEIFMKFLQTMQTTQRNSFTQSVTLLSKGDKKQGHYLIIRLLHSIQDLEYYDLVNFVELLSIIISYNETSIEILFKAPMFQGYYDQKMNFEILLSKKLLCHVSGEIRRRAVWLLSNITGSEEFYSHGLSFLKSFYLSNILDDDSSHELTKEEALIKESILQAIMNYLSNLRSFKEVEELIGFDRKNQEENAQQFQEYESQKLYNFNNSLNKQSLFIWIIRTLASVVQNLSSNNAILKNTQKFIEVLIYSLYNLLILQENEKQVSKQNPHIVLSIMETYSIPKYLQTIYQNVETTNQYSRFFTMMEALLDLIQKVKNQS